MTAAELAAKLEARPTSNGWECRCPAHEDKNASLSIGEGTDGRVLLRCFAGCSFGSIVHALGLKERDLFPPRSAPEPSNRAPRLVKTYDYTAADGALLFQVCRYDPKTFKQRRPDPEKPSAWLWSMKGVERVLYHLPAVLKAGAEGRAVFIVEGEKDVEALESLGLCATCNPGGAGKWAPAYTEALAGAKVYILPDKDAPGRNHAALAMRELEGKAESVRVVELPDRDGVKDAADWVAAGGTVAELREIVRTAPEWTPPAPVEARAVEPPPPEPTGATGGVEAIRAALWGLTQEKIPANEFYRKAAAAVVDWLHGRGRFYYHAERPDFAGVMYFDNERKLLLPIGSDAFLAWLSDCLGVNRSERVFQFAASAIETEGLSARATGIIPAAYWAGRLSGDAPAIYISSGPGRMARITPGAVEIVDNGADDVLFPAGAVLEPWHLVEDGRDPFEECSIFRDMATAALHGRELVRLWTMTLFADYSCKPPLCVSSCVGGGKTALIRGVFRLLGIVENITAVNKNGEGDFWATLDGGGLACFDNADTRIDWLPDALAAASTAGSHQKRKLYTDSDRVTLRARAAVAITSASPSFASDAGLADRLLVVRLQRRTGETAESTLFNEVTAGRDAGLSWISRVLSAVLADTAPTPGRLNARHPDFASFAVRIGRAMGREAEAVEALRAAERDKSLFNLENDTVGAVLLEMMQTGGRFMGTAAELLVRMKEIDPGLEGTLSTKRLSKRLEKLWPHLEATFRASRESGHGGFRYLTLFPPANGDFGDFETAFQQKSLVKENIETLPKTSIQSHQSHHEPAPTLFDACRKLAVSPPVEAIEPISPCPVEAPAFEDYPEPPDDDENAELYP